MSAFTFICLQQVGNGSRARFARHQICLRWKERSWLSPPLWGVAPCLGHILNGLSQIPSLPVTPPKVTLEKEAHVLAFLLPEFRLCPITSSVFTDHLGITSCSPYCRLMSLSCCVLRRMLGVCVDVSVCGACSQWVSSPSRPGGAVVAWFGFCPFCNRWHIL